MKKTRMKKPFKAWGLFKTNGNLPVCDSFGREYFMYPTRRAAQMAKMSNERIARVEIREIGR